MLGADVGANRKDRAGRGRSDSIMLLRTDPDDHRLSFLSIPRDLRVEIPGYGADKINAAYQFGGPALAVQTVAALTGMPVNHIVVVDFATFRGPDRRDRRDHDRRSRSRSSRTSSTARYEARTRAHAGRAGASRRASSI